MILQNSPLKEVDLGEDNAAGVERERGSNDEMRSATNQARDL